MATAPPIGATPTGAGGAFPGGDEGARGAEARALDLQEGIRDPRVGCARWPEGLWLLNRASGELVQGRCRATNLCRYCQTLYVVETVEMLTLDALEWPPVGWVVLTAREHLTRAACTGHLRQLRRSLRRRWPELEWFVQVEFQRRGALHLNLLLKGLLVDELEELHGAIVRLWCSRVDARPVGQWSGVVDNGEGLVRYLAKTLAHGLKAEQAPPIGWRGHRTSQTRGYLVRPASEMREEARAALRTKRLLWRARQIADGCDVEAVYEQLAAAELEQRSEWVMFADRDSSSGRPRYVASQRWADTGRVIV